MGQLRVVSVSRVAPSSSSQQQQQQQGGERVKLHYLDVCWVWLPAVQYVFLYDDVPGDGDGWEVASRRLKASLAATLTDYLPLAGRLEYEADTGHIVVDCSDAGVAFTEADAPGMDVRRLAYDEAHDMPAFLSLVPELDARVLPAPACSVQVTRLGACGLAVGLSVHHAVADGRALWGFIEAWASSCRGTGAGTGPPISFRRDAIHYPRADELARAFLKHMAPNLPVVSPMELTQTQRQSSLLRLERRTFHFGADAIRSLKQRIHHLSPSPNPAAVSTFVALAALSWTAFVRAKGLGAGDDSYLFFFADVRARLHPPLLHEYFGNCLRECVAECADSADIAGEDGILYAARAVQAVLAQVEAAPLPRYDEALSEMTREWNMSRMTNVVGSPSFRGYHAADFGFGKPALVEVVSMNDDGQMMLHAGRHDGEVQVSVAIHPTQMPTFKAHILSYLPSTLSRI